MRTVLGMTAPLAHHDADLRKSIPLPRVVLVSLVVLLVMTIGPGQSLAEHVHTDPDSEEPPHIVASAAVRPVPGQVIRRFDPPDHAYGPGHRGVDLAATGGAVVRTTLPGRISFSGLVARTGWVTVDHGAGLRTTYGPVTDRLDTGVAVVAGAVIGRLEAGAIHLDWGARLHDDYIDPLSLLSRWTLRLTRL